MIARSARVGWALLALAFAASGPLLADGFLYYVDGDSVVITNTPSRSDVRPLPGFERARAERARSARQGAVPASPWDRFIERVGHDHGIDADLIRAVAWVESGFDPNAVSPKGAVGLMQLMPATAAEYGASNLRDPYVNLRTGTRHLRRLLDEFEGDTTLALAAYNAGSGAVRRHGGVPAYAETRRYVRKVHHRLGDRPRVKAADRIPQERPLQVVRDADGSIRVVN